MSILLISPCPTPKRIEEEYNKGCHYTPSLLEVVVLCTRRVTEELDPLPQTPTSSSTPSHLPSADAHTEPNNARLDFFSLP